MKVTAGALLSLVAAVSLFCAHSAKSEVMVDDPAFAEFTVYNSVTGQHAKNGPVFARPEKGEGVFVRIRTKRSCSPVFEVALLGNVVGSVASVYSRELGPVPADTTIDFVWDLCWSPEVVQSVELMDVSKFHKGTMWLDEEGRFLLMPLILERPDLYPVKDGQFLPDPYVESEVFNTYRHCSDGGILVLGHYLAFVRDGEEDSSEYREERLARIWGEYRGLLGSLRDYGRVRWRILSIKTDDPAFVPRDWPERKTRSEDELRGGD